MSVRGEGVYDKVIDNVKQPQHSWLWVWRL